MNKRETGQVVLYVNSFERRTMTEDEVTMTAFAWHDVLGDLDYEDVMQAVREFFAEPSDGRYFKPGDIAYRARRLASRRCERSWDARTWEIHRAAQRRAVEREQVAGQIEGDPVQVVVEAMTKEIS